MALLKDGEVYNECRDQTKSIYSKVLKQILDKKKLHWTKIHDQYIKLHPPDDNSSPAKFCSFPKIYKAYILFRPIVSACGTSAYKLAKFLTNILHWYCGNSFSFVKDSKGLVKSLTKQKVDPDKILAFFMSVLFLLVFLYQKPLEP